MKEVGVDENCETKPCLIIYDYFKIMDESDVADKPEHQVMGDQINKLTAFATLSNVPVLAFVQANRSAITSESTDIISQSDRLLWGCGSACFLRRKSQEEQIAEGMENGNMKLIPLECRYGPGLEDDWINFSMDGNYAKLVELTTHKQSQKKNKSGLETEDAGGDSVPFDV